MNSDLTSLDPTSLGPCAQSDGPVRYLVFPTLELEATQPDDATILYVQGVLEEDGSFCPTSEVLGEGPLATKGSRGWLELKEQEFHKDNESREKSGPAIDGYLGDNGFTPSSKTIDR